MEGKGKIDPLLNHQIQAPETKAFFAHFHKDGKYIERDDVWINYLKRRANSPLATAPLAASGWSWSLAT